MGYNLEAHLVYGVDIGGEDAREFALPEFFEDDIEEWLAVEFCGLPILNIPSLMEYSEENKHLFHEYWDQKREALKKLDGVAVDLFNCMDYNNSLFIHHEPSKVSTYYASKLIDLTALKEPDQNIKDLIVDIARRLGYEGEIKMGWHLVPSYF